jgi:hypothetical protein
MDAQALLEEADTIHDDDPVRGADLLRRIDAGALPTDKLPLLGFLVNHVFGEKLGDWAEAHARQSALMAAAVAPLPAVLHRHAAVAARLAGDGAAAGVATQALAQAAAAGQIATAALQALQAPHWQTAGALDVPAAALCNNLGSALVDRPLADLADPALRQALALAADRAQRLWQRAGDWVNHERAAYLCALAASALGDAGAALRHAQGGLALIDANDAANEQSVDRAFLGLEASFALERIGRADQAARSRATADALAAAFNDAGLAQWYADRLARNEVLRG